MKKKIKIIFSQVFKRTSVTGSLLPREAEAEGLREQLQMWSWGMPVHGDVPSTADLLVEFCPCV